MFDWYETISDILWFSLYFSVFWEALTLVIAYSSFTTSAPAWLVTLISFSWEKIPLVFVFSLMMRGFTRSQLHDEVPI